MSFQDLYLGYSGNGGNSGTNFHWRLLQGSWSNDVFGVLCSAICVMCFSSA